MNMKRFTTLSVAILLFIAGTWSVLAFRDKAAAGTEKNGAQAEIKWLSMEEAMALHEKEPKYWIIDVYTDWCGWCKRMDATTFQDPHIVKEINAHFYAVKLDAEQKEDIVVKDRTYKYVSQGQRGYNELAAELLQGRLSYPTTVYLDKNINIIQPLPGFQSAQDLHPILQYFGTGSYTSTPWEDFKSNYKSPY